MTNILYPVSPAIVITYDALNRATTMVDAVGTTAYTYSQVGQLISEDGPWTNDTVSLGYRYDNEGELISARGYESGGMTSRTNEFFGYVYDAAGNLQYRTNSGLVQTFSVNANNELTTVARSGTLTVSGATTTNATSVTVNGSTATRYGDATLALGGFTITNVVLSTTVRSNLTGWAGLRFAVGSSPVVVTALGRWVVSGNSGSHALKLVRSDGNDVPGATATVNLSGISTNQFSYASLSTPVVLEANTTYFLVSQEVTNGDKWYDYNSTLTPNSGFTINGTVWALNGTTSYTVTAGTNSGYIPVNLKFTTGGWNLAGETRYIYDGMTVVQERDQNNVPLVTYTRGQDLSGSLQGAGGIGGLLARTDQTASTPTHAYYHADGNGNITAMISYQQNLVAKYLYDPFGNILSKSGLLANLNTYRFSSKEWHSGSTLYYYGYRFYSPNCQRWVNKDPIGEDGGINVYAYVYNNPISIVDRFGLLPELGPEFLNPEADLLLLEIEADEQGTTVEQLIAKKAAEKALKDRFTNSIPKIAKRFGKTRKEVGDAIHKAKESLQTFRGKGNRGNPDVTVDPTTGEIYPEVPGGGLGDPIGNIVEFFRSPHMSEKTATASLRIFTDESDPEFIAVAIDAKATRQYYKGELRSKRNPLSSRVEQSICIYESSLPDTSELKEHVAHILTFLESKRHAVECIRAQITDMDIFCMFSSESGQGAATLNADLLKRLAEQRVDLIIDLYPPGRD